MINTYYWRNALLDSCIMFVGVERDGVKWIFTVDVTDGVVNYTRPLKFGDDYDR